MAPRFGGGKLDHAEAIPHGLNAARQIDKPRGNGVMHIHAGEEIRPTDAARPAHIGGIHMEKLDRRDSDAGSFENEGLEGDIVVIVILGTAAALHLAQSPCPMREAFEHVHPDADAVVLEGRLENGGDTLVDHQSRRPGDSLRMPPGRLVD